MRVFRDSTGLSVNPHLWGSIQTAMDESEWFILLTSPEAASSPWVNREIEHWKTARDPDRILPVLTDGEWHWDDATGDFDRERSTALPESLVGVYEEEPRHLDLRWARKETQLDLRNSRFRNAMAELAAPIRGTTKDELEDDDIRLHRRAVRSAFAGVVVLAVALVAAVVGAALAVGNAHRAEDRERDAQARALSATSRSLLADQLDVALLLAVEANNLDASAETRGSLVAALERSPQLERILQTDVSIQQLDAVTFSADGSRVAAGGTYVARDPDEPAENAPVFRWDLDGTALETWTVQGGTAYEVGNIGDDLSVATIGEDDGLGVVGADQNHFFDSPGMVPILGPDGTRGAVYRDNAIELIDLESGAQVARVSGDWQIGLPVFSPDDRWVVLPAATGTAVVVDAASGTRVGVIGVAGDEFASVVFSADGDMLAVAQESGSLALYAVSIDGVVPHALTTPEFGLIADLALSADGARLAVFEDGRLTVWDTERGQPLWVETRPAIDGEPMTGALEVALSPDGLHLIETGPGGSLLRDASTGAVLAGPEPDGVLATSDDGTRAAVTGTSLSVWDLANGELLGTHPAGDGGAVFSPENRYLATIGSELSLWDLSRPELTPVALDDEAETASEIAFDADSTRLASIGDGRAARVWSLQGSTGLTTVMETPNPDAYGRLAAIDPAAGTTAVAARYRASVVVQTPEEGPVDIDVNDDIWFLDIAGDRLVTREPTGNDETGSVLWDVTTGEAIGDFLPCGSGDSAFLSSRTMMTDERIVNVNQSEISVCDAEDGDELARHTTPDETELPFEGVFSAALSPDGELAAIGSPNGTVTVVDLASGDGIETIPFDDDPDDGGIVAVAFGPDGRDLLFARSFPGQVGVWRVGDAPDVVQVLEPDAERVTAVAMSPDGNRIAVAGKTAVTDAPTEIELLARDGEGTVGEPLPWPYPRSEIFDLEYAADGSELYGTSDDGGLVRWEVTDTAWRDLACRLAGRNLTRAEWDRYLPNTDYRATCPELPDGE